jgi:hypothetical protein
MLVRLRRDHDPSIAAEKFSACGRSADFGSMSCGLESLADWKSAWFSPTPRRRVAFARKEALSTGVAGFSVSASRVSIAF